MQNRALSISGTSLARTLKRQARKYNSAGRKGDITVGWLGIPYIFKGHGNHFARRVIKRDNDPAATAPPSRGIPWSPGEHHDALVRSTTAFTISNVERGKASQRKKKKRKEKKKKKIENRSKKKNYDHSQHKFFFACE